MRVERPHLKTATILALAAAVTPGLAGDVRVSHLYNLSDFTGTIPYNYASLHIDRAHDETYVLYQNVVRIFNASGMEVFRFGNPDEAGLLLDVTVDDVGDIYTLSRRLDRAEVPFLVQRRNYRGEPLAAIVPVGIPSDWTDYVPTRIFHHQERLLLVDTSRMLALETDRLGQTLRVLDLGAMIGIAQDDRPDTQISGLDWDVDGNVLLTVPVAFRAFVVSPEGVVRAFGKGGSVPGSFGIVSGITRDERGLYYVADKLRSVVMIFDADFGFVTEFGHRGWKPENLIAPNALAVSDSGRLHVTQLRNRGVAVFAVSADETEDPEPVQARVRKEVPQQPHRFRQPELFSSPGAAEPTKSPDLQAWNGSGALGGPPPGGG